MYVLLAMKPVAPVTKIFLFPRKSVKFPKSMIVNLSGVRLKKMFKNSV